MGGLWALAMLMVKTRGRVRGPYWRWRYETAFGTDPAKMPARGQRWRAVLDYGRWLHRMRRFM